MKVMIIMVKVIVMLINLEGFDKSKKHHETETEEEGVEKEPEPSDHELLTKFAGKE